MIVDRHEKSSVLIVGYGSIGRRHFENAKQLGIRDIHILRSQRESRSGLPSPKDAVIHVGWDEALRNEFDFAVVANPTSLHARTAIILLEAGIPVLLEKPVDACLDTAQRMMLLSEERSVPVSMGYCFRYHPLYLAARRESTAGHLGEIRHVRLWQASYLPHWHPGEDYRKSYAANAGLGGGVVKTLDHELDMLRWLLGDPQSVYCMTSRMPSLGTDVEDTADMIFQYTRGRYASVHVSFARPGYWRGLSIVGARATCSLNWRQGTVAIDDGRNVREVARIPASFKLNSIYVTMLHEAINGFSQPQPCAAVPLGAGIAALRMAEASLRSAKQRREVRLDEVS